MGVPCTYDNASYDLAVKFISDSLIICRQCPGIQEAATVQLASIIQEAIESEIAHIEQAFMEMENVPNSPQ